MVEYIRQCQRQQLVGADGIVRRRFLRADQWAIRVEAVAQAFSIAAEIQF